MQCSIETRENFAQLYECTVQCAHNTLAVVPLLLQHTEFRKYSKNSKRGQYFPSTLYIFAQLMKIKIIATMYNRPKSHQINPQTLILNTEVQNINNAILVIKASVKTNLDICNINKKQLSLEHLQQPKLPEDDRLPPAHKMAGIGDPKLQVG